MPTGLKRIETARGHRYTLDGQDCPGVTTLINGGIPKPALVNWAARSVAEYVVGLPRANLDSILGKPHHDAINDLKNIPNKIRDSAATRGTTIHSYADKLVKDQDVDVPIHLAGYVQAVVDFLNTWRIAPVHTEATIGSRQHRYCGTVDLICDLPDGRRALMDYKTSKSGIWPETALQLAAYRNAEFVVTNEGEEYPLDKLGITCTYAIWVKDGSYEVRPINTGPEVFDVFLAAATTATAAPTMKAWVGEPEIWKAAA